jgi:hypothetical protein
MKRFVLFPLLVGVAAACQDTISTAPIPGADFAKGGGGKPDCTVDPSHPTCEDGGDEETAFAATDLGTLGGKKGTSAATDISDLTGGKLAISGVSAAAPNVETVAVRWELSDGRSRQRADSATAARRFL